MKCDTIQALLIVRQELSWADQQIVQTHLQSCKACQSFWADVQATRQALRLLPIEHAQLDRAAVATIARRLAHDPLDSAPARPRPHIAARGLSVALLLSLVALALLPLLARYPAQPADPGASASHALGQAEPPQAPGAPSPAAQALAQATMTILVLGSDARPNQTAPFRTDSVTLIHIDQPHGQISVVSLPRDLWIRYPDQQEGRLNMAYAYGEQRNGAGAGSAFVKQAVSELLNTPIDYTLLVRFDGFVQLVDRLGGITIAVPKAIDDPQYPADNDSTVAVHFDAGPQKLDGQRALIYARIRHDSSDFQRIQRQQQVIQAILTQIHESGILQQPKNIIDLFSIVHDAIDTDIPQSAVLELAQWGQTFDQVPQVRTFSVDETMVTALDAPATFALKAPIKERIVKELLDPLSVEK